MELTREMIEAVHAAQICQATTLSAHGNRLVKCGQTMAAHDQEWHSGADPITGENRTWEL